MRRPKIILDMGNNHEGDIYKAIAAIEIANNAKVDAIKFQHYNSKELKKDFDYSLKIEEYQKLAQLCEKVGLKWGCSFFESTWNDVNLFKDMGMSFVKIAASQNKSPEFINEVAMIGLPVYVSYNLKDLKSWKRLRDGEQFKDKEIYQLVCRSEYPCLDPRTPLQMCNYKRGYSCHTPGYHSVIAAQLLGVEVIEKHFTLDHNTSDFRDHKHALDPQDLSILMSWMLYYSVIKEDHEMSIKRR